MSDQSRTRRLTVGLTAETVEALEAEAERRGVTIVSLAGFLLTQHAQQLTHYSHPNQLGRSTRFCAAVGDETVVAAGLAFNDASGSWHPYCAECLEKLERTGDQVHRFY